MFLSRPNAQTIPSGVINKRDAEQRANPFFGFIFFALAQGFNPKSSQSNQAVFYRAQKVRFNAHQVFTGLKVAGVRTGSGINNGVIIVKFVQFGVISVMGLAIRIPILKFGEPLLLQLFESVPFQIPFFTPDFLAKNMTLAVAVIIVMFWNFFINRYWTYNDVD